jgi:hypothetical protein
MKTKTKTKINKINKTKKSKNKTHKKPKYKTYKKPKDKTHKKPKYKTHHGSGLLSEFASGLAHQAIQVPDKKNFSIKTLPGMKHFNINMLDPNNLKNRFTLQKENNLTVLINNTDTNNMTQPISIVNFYRVPRVRVNINFPCYLIMHDNVRILWLTIFKNRMISGSPILPYKAPNIKNGKTRTYYVRLYSLPINQTNPNDLSNVFKADYQDTVNRKLAYAKFFEHVRQFNLKLYNNSSVEIKIIANSGLNFYNVLSKKSKPLQNYKLQEQSFA